MVMSIKKQPKKKMSVCTVTFQMTKGKAASAKDIHLVGDFNSWDTKATPMKKQERRFLQCHPGSQSGPGVSISISH